MEKIYMLDCEQGRYILIAETSWQSTLIYLRLFIIVRAMCTTVNLELLPLGARFCKLGISYGDAPKWRFICLFESLLCAMILQAKIGASTPLL